MAFNAASLSADGTARLMQWATYLKRYGNMAIRLEGHCDERGTEEYNLALGMRRATAVRDYLVAQGVDPKRMTVISLGKEMPDPPGSTEAAWSQNRAVIAKETNAK